MADNKKKVNPVVNYFKEVKSELKKVAWPTYKQIQNNTVIVIVSVVIVGLFIALLDFGFGKGYNYLTDHRLNKEQTQTDTQTPAQGDGNDIVVDNAEVGGDAVNITPQVEGNQDGGAADGEANTDGAGTKAGE